MGIKLRGAFGIGLILIGIYLFLTGQQGMAEYQTSAGQLVRALSSEQQAQYQQYSMMRLIGAGTAILGGVLVLLDLSGSSDSSSSGNNPSGAQFSGYDHDTISPGSFTHYQFKIKEPSILDGHIEVLNGNPINMIVTSKKNLDRFSSTGDIKYHGGTTGFQVTDHKAKARLPAGEWAIILDNTNRVGETENQDPTKVDVELNYEVRS